MQMKEEGGRRVVWMRRRNGWKENMAERKKPSILHPLIQTLLFYPPLASFPLFSPRLSLFKCPFFFSPLSVLFFNTDSLFFTPISLGLFLSPPLYLLESLFLFFPPPPISPLSHPSPFFHLNPFFSHLPLRIFVFVYPAILRAAPGWDIWRSPLCYCHPLTQLSVGITDT